MLNLPPILKVHPHCPNGNRISRTKFLLLCSRGESGMLHRFQKDCPWLSPPVNQRDRHDLQHI